MSIEAINSDLRVGLAIPPLTPGMLPPSPYGGGSRSSDQPNSSFNQRESQGNCFLCRQPGHWRGNCPLKRGAAQKPPPPSPDLLIVRCHCALICYKTVSAGKEVHICSNRNVRCSVKIPAEEVNPIMCPCGVGAAALNVTIKPKFGTIKFYSCRIKKGLGACEFIQLENPRQRENKEIVELVLNLRSVKGQLSQEDQKELPSSCPAKLHHEVESSDPESSRDLALLKAATFNPIVEEEATRIPELMSGSEIHHRQMEFENQISAAAIKEFSTLGGSSSNGDTSTDWLTPGSSAGSGSADVPVSCSPVPERSFAAVEDQSTDSMVKILGEKLKNELAMILQSLEELQFHPSKNALQVLIQQMNSNGDTLQAQASSLTKADTEMFHSSSAELRSAISWLEVQTQVEKSINFPHGSYNADGSLLDGVCSVYTHTMAAFAASDEQHKAVTQHVFTMRDTLLKISSQVQDFQAEILKLDTSAMKTYRKMVQAQTTTMAASENLLRVAKSYQQRNGQYHSPILSSKRIELSSSKSEMVREGKRQKLEASST